MAMKDVPRSTRRRARIHWLTNSQDVIADFQKLTEKELPGINAGLKRKKAEAISVLTESDWQKKRAAEGSSGAGAGMFAREGSRAGNGLEAKVVRCF